MQNIKNFRMIAPTPKLLAEFNNDASVLFLESESGLGWYAAQKLFSDDTVKIQYDSTGVITSVVDEPIPQRGNIYAVSMLWPVNASVAEIAVADYPAGVELDGTWKFDPDTNTVYQDSSVVDAAALATNTRLRNQYAAAAALSITTIQSSAAAGNQRDGDSDNLLLLQQYLGELRDADLTVAPLPPPVSAF